VGGGGSGGVVWWVVLNTFSEGEADSVFFHLFKVGKLVWELHFSDYMFYIILSQYKFVLFVHCVFLILTVTYCHIFMPSGSLS